MGVISPLAYLRKAHLDGVEAEGDKPLMAADNRCSRLQSVHTALSEFGQPRLSKAPALPDIHGYAGRANWAFAHGGSSGKTQKQRTGEYVIRRIHLALALAALSCAAGAARSSPWPPSMEHPQVPLWQGAPPDPFRVSGPERVANHPRSADGIQYTEVSNVSKPTLTIYPPQHRKTDAAVLVLPGGGYWTLAIDLEGTEVCDWLTSNGITCILVKYRVPSYDKKIESRSGPYPDSPAALEDSQRAIALTRFNARKWGIDPNKIGVLGFSAGGHLVAATSTQNRIYKRTDAIDDVSVRPDFGMALYPGHLWINEEKFELNTAVPVNSKTPPQFIVQSEADPVDDVNNSLRAAGGGKLPSGENP